MKSLLKNKGNGAGLIVVFAVMTFLGPAREYAKAEAKSECIACHTDLKELIRLSREIEKIRPGPSKSAETSGKG
jgi:hypothetical protein